MRTPKELLIASKQFTGETRWLSWWHVLTTAIVLSSLIAVAVSNLPMFIRIVASLAAGVVGVRGFVIYHDYQHHSILQNSKLASFVMGAYGFLTLTPTSIWKDSHDDHHQNNSQTFSDNVGSYPIMTTEAYQNAGRSARFYYAASRHPITIALGYLSVFLWRMSLHGFITNPKKHFDGGLAVVFHICLLGWLWTLGWDVLILGMIIPFLVASALGSYLFYAQHNYPGAKMMEKSEWSHVDAALYSSSFMPMSRLMHWCTANIGFHHVHHLNSKIPFYRLPEAMAALEELQSPVETRLVPRDVIACFRLKLWSPEAGQFVGFNGT